MLPKHDVAGSNPVTRSIKHKPTSCLTQNILSNAIARYEVATRAAGYSPATVRHTVKAAGYFGKFLGDDPEVSKIGLEHYRAFICALREQKVWQGRTCERPRLLSPTSVNTYARALRAFWGWLEREGLIAENPMRRIPAPKLPRKLPQAFTEEEVVRILRTADGRPADRAMVYLFVDSGIRLSELLRLNLTDIDLTQRRLKVCGKGGKERQVFFCARTAEVLKDYIRFRRPKDVSEDGLFLNSRGRRPDRARVGRIMAEIGRTAGLSRRLSPHKLRHTYATLALRYGNNLEYLKLSLGHADIETTSRAYLAASTTDVERAQRLSSPIGNLFR